jgi:hypothetical protein
MLGRLEKMGVRELAYRVFPFFQRYRIGSPDSDDYDLISSLPRMTGLEANPIELFACQLHFACMRSVFDFQLPRPARMTHKHSSNIGKNDERRF